MESNPMLTGAAPSLHQEHQNWFLLFHVETLTIGCPAICPHPQKVVGAQLRISTNSGSASENAACEVAFAG